MGTPLRGRYASVKIGSTLIQNLGKWGIGVTTDEIDASVFGTTWKQTMTGYQGWSGSLEGFYDVADTTGQLALQNAMLSATKVTDIRFYIDSTSYWTPDVTNDSDAGCYVSSMNIEHDKAGIASVSFNVVGYGQLGLYDT